jgi:hypothetical protein
MNGKECRRKQSFLLLRFARGTEERHENPHRKKYLLRICARAHARFLPECLLSCICNYRSFKQIFILLYTQGSGTVDWLSSRLKVHCWVKRWLLVVLKMRFIANRLIKALSNGRLPTGQSTILID